MSIGLMPTCSEIEHTEARHDEPRGTQAGRGHATELETLITN